MTATRRWRTRPEVFIIESLRWEDEIEGRHEGRILTDILRLSGKEPIYYYMRTRQELVELMGLFQETRYRYLHLSCHGDKNSIETTLDDIQLEDLGEILNPYLDGRRLFISSCEVVNKDLAEAITGSGCLSIAGPTEAVPFSDAAILWASFYKIAFDWKSKGMDTKDITLILDNLATLSWELYTKVEPLGLAHFPRCYTPALSNTRSIAASIISSSSSAGGFRNT